MMLKQAKVVNLLLHYGSKPVNVLGTWPLFEKCRSSCIMHSLVNSVFNNAASETSTSKVHYTSMDKHPACIFNKQKLLQSASFYEPIRKASGTIFPNKKTKALALIKDLKEVRSSPTPALVFGISGLVPFVAAPFFFISQGVFVPSVAYAQAAYGACILSFLGGIRWGFTLPEEAVQSPSWRNLGWSVAAPLVAWTGMLMPPALSILSVIGGLGIVAYLDLIFYGYPIWFKALRFCLTLVAVLSLWTTLTCNLLMSTEKKSIVNDNDAKN